ncbi:MAG: hypothetical protein AAFN77_12720 [Planctomycetota bacterium]
MIKHSRNQSQQDRTVSGSYTEVDGKRFYKIENVHQMPTFFMTMVSGSNHWAFIASNGAITAGRRCADSAIFPYYSSDKLLDQVSTTGPLTIVQLEIDGTRLNWTPFAANDLSESMFDCSRNIYKNKTGSEIIFEERNHTLDLLFRYRWQTGDQFGLIRTSHLVNLSDRQIDLRLLDGIQNVVPSGLTSEFQLRYSNLGDAYKKNELVDQRLGLFYLSSVPSDRAEPSEGLRATTVWQTGLESPTVLLSGNQISAFRQGEPVCTEFETRGRRGAFLLCQSMLLGAHDSVRWSIAADIGLDQTDVVALQNQISQEETILQQQLKQDIQENEAALAHLIASADGAQCTEIQERTDRHWSNVTFNVMRGGVPMDGYRVSFADLSDHISQLNPSVATKWLEPIGNLFESSSDQASTLELDELIAFAKSTEDHDFQRIVSEYLPLAFSRRHGDPTRPWNVFLIDTRNADGSIKLNYQGNWRDIFQNWEALGLSFPRYLTSMLYRFVNASTIDGHNPYRLTKDGFDWERLDPNDEWANIGYWGDHQIIYQLKLIEHARTLENATGRDSISSRLHDRICVFANVPYRIQSYEAMLQDSRNTIQFDDELERQIEARVQEMGADGKLLMTRDKELVRVSLFEKLLLSGTVKAANLIPGGGIWLNTQRPEWNDANNALVGIGASVVTACYLRRYFAELKDWIGELEQEFEVTNHLHRFVSSVGSIFDELGSIETDQQRRQIVDQLQRAATEYREQVYAQPASAMTKMTSGEFGQFAQLCIDALDQTIMASKRDDRLYDAYNLISFSDERVNVEPLYEMLEGQVAALSAGTLSPVDSIDLLKALWQSPMFRSDQNSFMLYPDRELPSFLNKNVIAAELAQQCPLIQKLQDIHDESVVRSDENGDVRYNGSLKNEGDVRAALDDLKQTRPELAQLIDERCDDFCKAYEATFEHHRFTGRSGTFFGYEGLGSIYWHMVSKLSVAVLETYRRAQQLGDSESANQLRSYYRELQRGIGAEKQPSEYGAFPTDPYSHSPAGSGVRQPGMTGQVKEDILTRFNELGVQLRQGQIVFDASLIDQAERLSQPTMFEFIAVDGTTQQLPLEAGQIGFTYCQVPVIYSFGDRDQIQLLHRDESESSIDQLTLDVSSSNAIFDRDGTIQQIDVHFKNRFDQ